MHWRLAVSEVQKERAKANGSKVRGIKDTNQTTMSNQKNTTKAKREQEVGAVISDWSSWYRMLCGERFKEEDLSQRLMA